MKDPQLDHPVVRRRFAHAAKTYENHDILQREVGDALLERLDFYLETPTRVIDLGAGTGHRTALLKARWPKAEVVAIDLALPMLRQAKKHSTWRKPFLRVAGDATQLPLADHSVDVIYSNLCAQWIDNLEALFGECMRILKPGGFLAFSSLGPDTLMELRAAWASVDENPHVSRFLDMHDVGDIVLEAGLRDPVMDVFRYTMTYASPQALLDDLRGLGATNAHHARQRGLTGKGRYQAMLAAYEAQRRDGSIPATWEVVSGHAWGPPVGQPRRVGGNEVATFSIDQMRAARRKRG